MLKVCLLGCGGTMPLPGRWLTSLLLQYNGSNLLIDCGEGTQISLKENKFSPYSVDTIVFTHYHADHISGLPGLLLSIGMAGRTEPVTLIGPAGLTRIVHSLCTIAPEIPFPLEFHELSESRETFEIHGYHVEAFALKHNTQCYGYTVSIPRAGKFDIERAKKAEIPLRFWNPLQKGNIITDGDKVYRPEDVLGEPRRGLKVVYCTDSRPTAEIQQQMAGADLAVCEGMYGEAEKQEDALQKKHMMFQEAARLASRAAPPPSRLWLTHYSPSMPNPDMYLPDARLIFPQTSLGKDGKSLDLNFIDT